MSKRKKFIAPVAAIVIAVLIVASAVLLGRSGTENSTSIEVTNIGNQTISTQTSASSAFEGSTFSESTSSVSSTSTQDVVCSHSNVSYRVRTEPTCTSEGLADAYCADCSTYLGEKTLPCSPHSFSNGVCVECGAADASDSGDPYELPEDDL